MRDLLFNMFPHLKLQVLKDRYEYELNKEFKKLFNGNVVEQFYKEITNKDIQGKALGDFIKVIKQPFSTEEKHNIILKGYYPFTHLDRLRAKRYSKLELKK